MPGSGRSAASARLTSALARSRAWARPASTGARLAAYSIDVLACAVVAALVGALTRSAVIGGLVCVELGVILLVIEARTGVTLGNLVLRQRTARDDAPFSPGVGRGLVRGIVLGAGSLVALVGGWIVVATSAADPTRMGRSWADRAGRTLVVKVPTPAEREAWARNAAEWALSAPRAEDVVVAMPQPAPAPVLMQPAAIPNEPPVMMQPAVMQPTVTPPEPVAAMPHGVVAVDAPIAPAPPRREIGELLMLSFDTGQRERLRIPATVNLGRRPEPSDSEDQLIVVNDAEGSVSKTHLRLEYRGDSVWVSDLGSTNGSAVVDETGEAAGLPPGARVRLEDGVSVRIGQRSFTVAVVTGEL